MGLPADLPRQSRRPVTDLPVYDELPLDLAVVAGVITKAFQDASCHVNLKSKERGTPDMVLRDAGPQHPQLAGLEGKPVHFTVGVEGFKIELSTAAIVAQKRKERTNKPWTPLAYEPTDQLLSYAELCPSAASDCIAKAKRYGSKGANLGLLTQKGVLGRVSDAGSLSQKLGYNLVPEGIALPIKLYHDFVAHARLDHATAGMDVAIVPKYDSESPIAANAVAVTRVIGNDGIYGYSFSTQKGNNLVTNPTPRRGDGRGRAARRGGLQPGRLSVHRAAAAAAARARGADLAPLAPPALS